VADHSDGQFAEAADRYALAAFELARDAGALPALESDMNAFVQALQVSDDLRKMIHSPVIETEDKQRALLAVADKLGVSTLGRNVLGVIARNGRAAALPAFLKALKTRIAVHRGTRAVEIVSAAPLDADQLRLIVDGLAKELGVAVEPTVKVDASLIGGFIARAGSRQFDASIKSKLALLERALKSA